MSKKIAIISFFHSEASLCLAKYIAQQGVYTDFYFITDILKDNGIVPGFQYRNVKKHLGLTLLTSYNIPAISNYTKSLPIQFYLLRILSFSPKLFIINKIALLYTIRKIKKRHYDAINIIGQHPLVEIIHNSLRTENIIHSFHEIGSHQEKKTTTSLLNRVIEDKSKVILHSKSTYERFIAIPNAKNVKSRVIPFGKFETLLLYEKKVPLNLSIDVSKITFLFYGFIQPYKGLDLLKESVKLLNEYKTQFNLIIAGAGIDSNLTYFSAQNNCLVINRFLSNNEIMALNRLSSIILLPYKSASQSGIIPTSFMLGKPIIATKVGALGESIKNEVNGLLVSPNNPYEFSEAMKRIIQDSSLLKKLTAGALRFGSNDEFDWNNIAKETLHFFFTN